MTVRDCFTIKVKRSCRQQRRKGIPIATSLAKPKLVRSVRSQCSSLHENFNHISISHYSTRILQTQVRRISRSADDKEFGKYWKELPKQMRRVDEEEELEDSFTMATTPHRPRRDTDVHMLAFGSPTLSAINAEEGERRHDVRVLRHHQVRRHHLRARQHLRCPSHHFDLWDQP